MAINPSNLFMVVSKQLPFSRQFLFGFFRNTNAVAVNHSVDHWTTFQIHSHILIHSSSQNSFESNVGRLFSQGNHVLMLNYHIELVPGQSFRVGNLKVTLVCVDGENVSFSIDEDDNGPMGTEFCNSDNDSMNFDRELVLALELVFSREQREQAVQRPVLALTEV